MTDQDKQSISTISAVDRRNSTASSNTSITAGGNRQNHQHHRRNRANIHLDENSHLNVLRNWNHLLLQSAEMNCAGQNERPMAVVGGIGRTTLGEMDTNEENEANGLTDENVAFNGGSTFVRAAAIPHCQHTDWEALREFRVQEMNEIRQRAAHMENTMRWWLLSAEQWRERWMLAKGERNRLREENVRLRAALAKANAELRAIGCKKDGKGKVTTKSNNNESNEKQMAKIDEEMKGQKKNQKMSLERSNSF